MVRAHGYVGGRPLALVTPGDPGGTLDLIDVVHTDPLGTPRAMVPLGAETPSWQRSQTPFGLTHAETGDPGVTQPLRFPGQWADPATGLHYNYFRDYDPALGRYTTPDPIGLAGGDVNLYAYVRNNPVPMLDFYGLDTAICCRTLAPPLDRYWHCYAYHLDPIANAVSTYGLHGSPGESKGTIELDHPFDRSPANNRTCGPVDPGPQDQKWQCIQNVAETYPDPSNYDLAGPNSNTFAGICAATCGLTPPQFVAPGNPMNTVTPSWGLDIPAPWSSMPGNQSLL